MVSIRGDKRIDLGDAVIARYETGNKKFEILVNPKKAWDYLYKDKSIDIRDIVISFTIFDDAQRGRKASADELISVFGTDDEFEIARTIIEKGRVQITTEMRREFTKELRRKIIHFISRNAINPKTNLPHPPERIERAMEEAKVNIDPRKDVAEQAEEIVKKIAPIIPIRLERVSIAVRIPAEHAGKAYNLIARYGEISKDEWQADGSWIAVVDLPAGLQAEVQNELNNLSKGKFELKKLKK
ncbi:MAG: ribosome assembly factor SBDS [Candidatus Helarchaeales archaeon]